jgi:hypothetical protein
MMGRCGIKVEIKYEDCMKGLNKKDDGEVVEFKGWKKMKWFVKEKIDKNNKEWLNNKTMKDDNKD